MTNDANEFDIQEALGTLNQKFTEEFVQELSNEVQAALDDIAERHGLKKGKVSFRYQWTKLSISAEMLVRMCDGKSPEHRDWDCFVDTACGSNSGLKKEWFGCEVKLGHTKFKIVGANRRRPKNAIMLERVPDGKHFITSAASIVVAMKAKGK